MERSQAPATVLVADDEAANQRLITTFLQRAGHLAVCVSDGLQAVQTLENQPIDIVLLDVNMPNMDGWETLQRVRARYAADDLPVIVITGMYETAVISSFIEAGADDVLMKPFEPAILNARINNFLDRKRARSLLRETYERLQRDLDAAARIQQSILPARDTRVPGIAMHWEYQPCEKLAGDSFNIFRLDEQHVGVYILDVSGHGVPAALLAVAVSRLLSPVPGVSVLKKRIETPPWYRLVSPAEVAYDLNTMFPMTEENNQYFTFQYAIINISTRMCRIVSAGHPPPLSVVTHNGEFPSTPGFPIGWLDDPQYQEVETQLQPGDRLLFYTDGATEAANAAGEAFGLERLVNHFLWRRKQPINQAIGQLISEVAGWSQDIGGPHDDITLVGIELAS